MRIILGSASPRRQTILKQLGHDFVVMPADIDEMSIRYESAEQLTRALARAKNKALQEKIPTPAIIITADTVVTCDGVIYEKTGSVAEGMAWLRNFFGKTVAVYTSIVAYNTVTKMYAESTDVGYVQFTSLPEEIIGAVAKHGFSVGASGGFNIQDDCLIPYITLSGDIETILGMSSALVTQALCEVAEGT